MLHPYFLSKPRNKCLQQSSKFARLFDGDFVIAVQQDQPGARQGCDYALRQHRGCKDRIVNAADHERRCLDGRETVGEGGITTPFERFIQRHCGGFGGLPFLGGTCQVLDLTGAAEPIESPASILRPCRQRS